MPKGNRDNKTGRFVRRAFAKLNPLTTSETSLDRMTVTEPMIDAGAEALTNSIYDGQIMPVYLRDAAEACIKAALAARKA